MRGGARYCIASLSTTYSLNGLSATALQFSTTSHKQPASTPLPASWLTSVLPDRLLPYAHLMRLDKPIGKLPWQAPGAFSAVVKKHSFCLQQAANFADAMRRCILCRHMAALHGHAFGLLLLQRLLEACLTCNYWPCLAPDLFLLRGAGCTFNDLWDRGPGLPSRKNKEQTLGQRSTVCSSGDRSVSVP